MELVQGSLEPKLRISLTDGEGAAVALSEASSIQVRAELHDEQLFLRDIPGPLADDGQVPMTWEEGDTDLPGRLWIDVLVTWPGGRRQWFRAAEVVDIEPL